MTPDTGLSKAQAEAYIDRFASSRVCVVGDVMLDRYFWGSVDRISPEAPVPIVRVTRKSSRLGGAANVAANLRALGVQVALAGLVGDDRAGSEFVELLGRHDLASDHIATESGRETTEKVRIIAQSQQVVRADFEHEVREPDRAAARLLDEVKGAVDGFDLLIVSDYGKGLLDKESLLSLISAWRAKDRPVLVDPHTKHFRWYEGATVVTPNTKEAASFYGATPEHGEGLTALGFQMRKDLGIEALLITRGEEGMSLFLEGDREVHIPTVAKEVYDVTGAGDTVISTLGAGLASGAPLIDSVILANRAAGEAVKEIGTTTVTREELLGAFEG